MYPIYNYDFSTNSFYGDELPQDVSEVLRHLFVCAHNLFNLNGSTSGEVVDGLKPTYKVKWKNYI